MKHINLLNKNMENKFEVRSLIEDMTNINRRPE